MPTTRWTAASKLLPGHHELSSATTNPQTAIPLNHRSLTLAICTLALALDGFLRLVHPSQ